LVPHLFFGKSRGILPPLQLGPLFCGSFKIPFFNIGTGPVFKFSRKRGLGWTGARGLLALLGGLIGVFPTRGGFSTKREGPRSFFLPNNFATGPGGPFGGVPQRQRGNCWAPIWASPRGKQRGFTKVIPPFIFNEPRGAPKGFSPVNIILRGPFFGERKLTLSGELSVLWADPTFLHRGARLQAWCLGHQFFQPTGVR